HGVVKGGDLIQGAGELLGVVDEAGDHADGGQVFDGHPAADAHDQGEGDVVEQVAHRHDEPSEDLGAHGGLLQFQVGGAEFGDGLLFVDEGLDRLLPGDVLLDN